MSTFNALQEEFNILIDKYIHFSSETSGKALLYSFVTVLLTCIIVNSVKKEKKGPSFLQNIMNKLSEALSLPGMLTQGSLNNNDRYSNIRNPEYKKLYKHAMSLGGFPGGLANDGNTCFMNSVIQCLASSQELRNFLLCYASDQDFNNISETPKKKLNDIFKSFKQSSSSSSSSNNTKNDQLKHVQFSNVLLDLIENLNLKHGNNAPTYKTKELLRVMKDSPNKHLFLGYNQEDAQEFYQNVMKQVEKEFTDLAKLQNVEIVVDNEEKEEVEKNNYVDIKPDSITGLKDLGYLGDVFVPVSQIDPADAENENKYLPYKLITPVDGLQCDRIGCVNCGEMGGIRYSVTSGLALNLPINSANRNRFTLGELIDEFCKPDVIDGVECNRCSLVAIRENLMEKLDNLKNDGTSLKGTSLLIEKIESRITEIENVLNNKCIHDDVYKKLHTKNMVQKSRKVKQSFLSRPPALLCIHINRSVFDPRTYMVRKNNAKIDFPLELDLSDFVASVDDINLDARLEFRKQDEEMKKIDRGSLLKYKLKSLISHFGTHNYGHYIAFRKIRGNWWHISDEIVRLSTEEEVLGSQGTFMLFYELIDEVVPEISGEEEKYGENLSNNESESESDSGSDSDSDSDSGNDNASVQTSISSSGKDLDGANESISSDIESQDHIINIQANL